MNPPDDQRLRQRLREEFGALEISPAPVLRVTGRGRGIRARRRALTAGALVVVVAGGAVTAHVAGGRTAGRPPVSMSAPNPAAPGGVFASGTTDGKRWRLAVRNVAADPGTPWCLPAVMLNGHFGAIVGGASTGAFPILNGGVLTDPPGWPGAGFGFQVWSAGVTRLAFRPPGVGLLAQHPVAVTACGQRFLMSGYSFARAGVLHFTAYTRHGHSSSHFPLPDPARPWPPGQLRGLWSVGDSVPGTSGVIGSGTVGGGSWRIKQTLGPAGQCYTAVARARGIGGQARECEPIAAPPSAISVALVPFPDGIGGLTGYAGLVNPRTAYLHASVSNGTTQRVVPVGFAGRAYVAIVVPPGCELTWVRLFDASGHLFAQGKP